MADVDKPGTDARDGGLRVLKTKAERGESCSILLADPNVFLREKIAGILMRQENVWCVVQVSGREPAIRGVSEHQPDLVLVDISLLQDRDGMKLLRERSPGSRVVVMVEVFSEPYIKAACWLGADGIIEKSKIAEDIQQEIVAREAKTENH